MSVGISRTRESKTTGPGRYGDVPLGSVYSGPYTPSTVIILAIPATDDSLEVPEQIAVETILNMSPENKEHYQSKKEAIHLLLTGIGDGIYSTVNTCKTAHDISKATTKYKGKEIAKPITPPSESASKENSDPEQAQRDKDINNNVDTSPRQKNDNHTRQFGNLRTVIIVGVRETIGSQVVPQTGIQCFNYKEFGHFSKECRKLKRVKDYMYHKEKMLMCKQAEKGVPLQAKQADWLEETNEEIDEQEMEAHYSYMVKIQEVPIADSKLILSHWNSNTCVVEKIDSNVILDSPDMCDNDIQTEQYAKECDDERTVLANLITNLTLDTEENKKILKQLKKANASLIQELKESNSNLEESNTTRDSCLIALQSKQTEIETREKLQLDTNGGNYGAVHGAKDPTDYGLGNSLLDTFFDSRGAIPSKTAADAKVAIQEKAEYSQKWYNGTSRSRSTETSDGLAAIQAQLNNLGREIKKVNEKVYVAQVGCEQCKVPHYTKDFPLKEEGKTLEEAYYMQSMEDTLSKFMSESAKRQEENSNLIKEIRASTDAAIRNQGASIKTLEIQIRQISKGSYGPQFSKAYSEASQSIPRKEKDIGSFTLPCFINNVCFDNAFVDLGASVSVMPLLTYLNLGLGELAHTKLIVELADRTMKYLKGIAKNVLVGIGKFTFPIDFIILDMPEDIKVPLILERPFLSTARAKNDVYKRKITLRVGEERIIFTSVKPASSLIKKSTC
ncbi:retrovirus-related pol polyprotein from transposon TNT 1-94 [Tanacetum coccineum]